MLAIPPRPVECKPEEGLVDAAACFLSRSSRAKTSAVSAPEEYMFPAPPLPVEIKPEGPRDRDREVEMLPTPPRPVERGASTSL